MGKWIFVVIIVGALATLIYVSNSDSPTSSNGLQLAPGPAQRTTNISTPIEEALPSETPRPDTIVANAGAMDIRWYKRPLPAYPYPSGTIIEKYLYYKPFAEAGDGFAAHQLANMVLGCSIGFGSFQNQEELDRAMAQMSETFTYVEPVSGHQVRADSAEEAEIYITGARNQFKVCKEVVGEPREAYMKWLEIGANDGYTVAMLDYGNQLKDRRAAVELFRDAWLLGDPYALHTLAGGLRKLYDKGIDPAAKVPAYAAMHAFVTLRSSVYHANTESVVGRITMEHESKLNELAREMLPEELDVAREQSNRLITSNKNCCYSM